MDSPRFDPARDPAARVAATSGAEAPRFDFGIVLALRLHEGNPWALERLERMAGWYDALPPVRVVDFGSREPFAGRLARPCARHGFAVTRVEDFGAFSLAAARNAGMRAEGPALRLITDIDFFLRPRDFLRIQELIEALDLRDRIDGMLNLPAWHLSEPATAALEAAPDPGRFLDRLAFDATHRPFGGDSDIAFAAPYSNVFLIHRDFFELVGGYDERFRGHGSEDFEFLTRAGLVSGWIAPPQRLENNGWGPLRPGFFAPKPYAGHRRFLEALALPTELTGLRAYHLHHATADPASADGWMSENDHKRERLAEAFGAYLEDRAGLVAVDHLPRPRRALCICLSPLHRDAFLPFRLLGYRLEALRGAEPEALARAEAGLRAGDFDLLLAFNPDAEAHAPFRPLIETARAAGVEVAVAQFGPLPGTLAYAPDMLDRAPGFDASGVASSVAAEAFSEAELAAAAALLADLAARAGAVALPERAGPGPRILVPLQPPADLDGAPAGADRESYAAFLAGLDAAAAAYPEAELLALPDPRARARPRFAAPNIRWLPAGEIPPAGIDAVICHSARAGLVAGLLGKPVICTGRGAPAVRLGLAESAPDAAAALAWAMSAGAARGGVPSGAPALPDEPAQAGGDLARVTAAWLTHRALSACVTPSGPLRPGLPDGRRYDGLAVSRLRWRGSGLALARMAASGRSSPESYAGGRLGMLDAPSRRRERIGQMRDGGDGASAPAGKRDDGQGPAIGAAARNVKAWIGRRLGLRGQGGPRHGA